MLSVVAGLLVVAILYLSFRTSNGQAQPPPPPPALDSQTHCNQDMVHLEDPAEDIGYFSTLEVRPRDSEHAGSYGLTSRTISFPDGHYERPPNIAGGFGTLDLAVKLPQTFKEDNSQQEAGNPTTPGYRIVAGVRANVVGSHITPTSFHIGLETWNGGIMFSGSAVWMEHRSQAKYCQFGQFDTMQVIEQWQKRRRERLIERWRRRKDKEDSKRESAANQTPGEPHVSGESESSLSVSGILSTSRDWRGDFPEDVSNLSSDFEGDRSDVEGVDNINLPTSYHHRVHFSHPYTSPPTVVTWLNRLDFSSSGCQSASPPPFRLFSSAKSTSATSTTLVLTTHQITNPIPSLVASPSSRTSQLEKVATPKASAAPLLGAALCYIAFPSMKPLVSSGRISITGSTLKRTELTGRVLFASGTFSRDTTPTVLAALSGFEVPGCTTTVRVGVRITWTTHEAFGWAILGPPSPDLFSVEQDNCRKKKGKKWKVQVDWIALG